MGQLEKYGLYVLCLVIFLILGVTIWGDGGVSAARRAPATTGLNASANAQPRGGAVPSAGPVAPAANGNAVAPNLQALLQPAARPVSPPARDTKPAEAGTGILNVGAGAGPGAGATPPNKDAGKPAAEPPPAAVVRPTYKVERGDTFDSIAKAKLGSSSLRTEIARLNPSVRPERLMVGQVLVLPASAELGAAPATADAPRSDTAPRDAVVAYTVGKGDTFEGIARRQLGDRKRVADLRELNPDVDPTRLRVGQKIRLPKK